MEALGEGITRLCMDLRIESDATSPGDPNAYRASRATAAADMGPAAARRWSQEVRGYRVGEDTNWGGDIQEALNQAD